ncbi:MAG: GNAT family N-acetyltransferase [Flavobacteriaceae bacterium]
MNRMLRGIDASFIDVKMTFDLLRTDFSNPDFISLVEKLDAYLTVVDGDEHDFYHQFNGLQGLQHVIVLYMEDTPVACGALKKFNQKSMEIKRMFVSPTQRKKGLASQVLHQLENWAKELGYRYCVLETGLRQEEAINLYNKSGYEVIPNYGPYQGVKNSVCFRKKLL